jgi:hypothetical protein
MKSEHLYRMLLKLYPARYRREYEDAMAQCFRDQLRTATTPGERLRLWSHTLADVMMTVPARHLEGVVRLAHHGAFEDYNEQAKRAIFFARYEAASFSGSQITVEHLLLGVLREDVQLGAAVLGRDGITELVRALESLEANPRRRPDRRSSVDIPLGLACKQALAKAGQQAQDSFAKVSPRRLLSAILNQDSSDASRLLRKCAIDLSPLTEDDRS